MLHKPEPDSDLSHRSRKQLLAKTLLPLLGLGFAYLAVSHFSHSAWPFAGANMLLVALAGAVLALSYVCRAIAWQYLFVSRERPCRGALMAASGAASVSGTVLPGRLDWAVKFLVLRRLRRTPVGVEGVAVSLGSLALLDAVATAPLAILSIVVASSITLKAACGVVVAGGLAAAIVYLTAAKLLKHDLLRRWPRVAGVLESAAQRVSDLKDSAIAWLALVLCWICRAAGLFILLGAMQVSYSLMLACVFVVLTAAAVVINFLPIGPAAQLGAGTAVLVGSHVHASQAASFALASNLLYVLAAGSGTVIGLLWYGRHFALTRMRSFGSTARRA